MGTEVVGTIVLYVNGQEVDCTSCTPKITAGRKPVSTMNSNGRVQRECKTTSSIALSVEVVIPETGDLAWDTISGATITIQSLDGTNRTTYTGVGVTTVGDTFTDGGEAKRSLEMYALDKIKES